MKKITTFLYSITLLFTTSAFAQDSLPDFSTLIQNNAKTVVQIDAKSKSRSNEQYTPEDLLRYFFDKPSKLPRESRKQSSRPVLSHGSGFFISSDGYILTNAHIVNNANEITVSTTDQTEYKAELVGLDRRTDVAVLKIDIKDHPAAKIGDSDKIKVGNWVLAIGSPFGFDYTATKGIISAVSRSLPDGAYVPFIQTDAAVNPGNSGGPLFNLSGEVIGINSQIYSSTGSFNGLAFAIPINVAIHVADQIKSKGYASRGWLGVSIQGIDQSLANSFNLKSPKGALISGISPDSPAKKAGLKVGDIITSFDGKEINKSSELPPLVGEIKIDTKVNIDIIRNGKPKKIPVIIGELDEGHKGQKNNTGGTDDYDFGLTLAPLSDEQKAKNKIEYGLSIYEVEPDSPADKSGLKKRDIILSVNNVEIKDYKTLQDTFKDVKKDKPAAILIIRNDRTLFLPLTP